VRAFGTERGVVAVAGVDDGVIAVHLEDPRGDVAE
jgi:hypothetical protein